MHNICYGHYGSSTCNKNKTKTSHSDQFVLKEKLKQI